MPGQLILGALLGACLGSFLNVVSLRFGDKQPLTGRSSCPHCHRQLRWWELVPVVSFLYLRGRCASCRHLLTWQYPFIEMVTALVWAWAFWLMPVSLGELGLALTNASLGTTLVLLWIIDQKYFVLPDLYLVILTVLVVVKLGLTGHPALISALPGAALGAGCLFLIWAATSGHGIGFGDVKLLVPLGLLFGSLGTLVLLFLAFVAGGITATVLLMSQKATLKTAVPFGPYLVAAAFVLLADPRLPERLFASFLN